MMDSTYREDSVASSVAAQRAAEGAAKLVRVSILAAVVAVACLAATICLDWSTRQLVAEQRAEIAKLQRQDEGLSAWLQFGFMNVPDDGQSSFKEIIERWGQQPCESDSYPHTVTMNGASIGETVCRINRLERFTRRVEEACWEQNIVRYANPLTFPPVSPAAGSSGTDGRP